MNAKRVSFLILTLVALWGTSIAVKDEDIHEMQVIKSYISTKRMNGDDKCLVMGAKILESASSGESVDPHDPDSLDKIQHALLVAQNVIQDKTSTNVSADAIKQVENCVELIEERRSSRAASEVDSLDIGDAAELESIGSSSGMSVREEKLWNFLHHVRQEIDELEREDSELNFGGSEWNSIKPPLIEEIHDEQTNEGVKEPDLNHHASIIQRFFRRRNSKKMEKDDDDESRVIEPIPSIPTISPIEPFELDQEEKSGASLDNLTADVEDTQSNDSGSVNQPEALEGDEKEKVEPTGEQLGNTEEDDSEFPQSIPSIPPIEPFDTEDDGEPIVDFPEDKVNNEEDDDSALKVT